MIATNSALPRPSFSTTTPTQFSHSLETLVAAYDSGRTIKTDDDAAVRPDRPVRLFGVLVDRDGGETSLLAAAGTSVCPQSLWRSVMVVLFLCHRIIIKRLWRVLGEKTVDETC